MSLIIEDRSGNLVKTLVPKGRRLAGTYNDEWDGKDDQGNTVGEGEYHAVLLYELNGKQKRFDLSTTTGGRTYNPSRTGIPSEFQPFAGKPLVIDFTLPKASEVTAFMGRFHVDTRLITFMQRKPLGSGTHRITWNGEDSSGLLIQPPPGDSFLFGIFGFELPDNAIYVRSGAHVENLTVSPSIFTPDSVGQQQSSLKFTLTANANVRLQIHDADKGKLIATQTFTGLTAGENGVKWDGKNNAEIHVAPGKYRLGISAIDSNGFQSITQYVVQQVYY
jgi:flagellar hook assembly protein FlgD